MNPYILATVVAVLLVVYLLYRARGFDRPLAAFQPPEPKADAPWRSDPLLRGLFLEGLPDDVPVVFYEFGSRAAPPVLEKMWVRLDRRVGAGEYEGGLLNAPRSLRGLREGDRVRVRSLPAAAGAVWLSPEAEALRSDWAAACERCGCDLLLEAPPADAGASFAARCGLCGGPLRVAHR